MTKGDHYMFWMIWLSLVGIVIMAKFFPHMLENPPEIAVVKSQPMPIWGLAAMSAPAFIIWCHFLYTEIKRIIKKHQNNWWKLKIK